ncbi:MAG: hypothetical protein ACTSSJ_07200 [Candidatus Odinarchaeia archaeon]
MKKDICKLDYYRGKKILMKKQLSDGTWIFTVKGKKGKEDFIVKAQLPSGTIITPKHAHFVIDLYGKICYDKNGAKDVFNAIEKVFGGISADKVLKDIKVKKSLPGYSLEYTLNCLELIFKQEDVNYPPPEYKGRKLAFDMLKDVFNGVHPVEAMIKAGLRI